MKFDVILKGEDKRAKNERKNVQQLKYNNCPRQPLIVQLYRSCLDLSQLPVLLCHTAILRSTAVQSVQVLVRYNCTVGVDHRFDLFPHALATSSLA